MYTYYKGFNTLAGVISFYNFPIPRANDNGVGVYMSEDIEVAERYGEYILTIVTPHKACITRPITNAPDMPVEEQIRAGMESVFSTEHAILKAIVDADLAMVSQALGDEMYSIIPNII